MAILIAQHIGSMPVESKQWFVEFGIALYFNVTRTVSISYLTFATKSTYTERQTYLIFVRGKKISQV